MIVTSVIEKVKFTVVTIVQTILRICHALPPALMQHENLDLNYFIANHKIFKNTK